MGERVKIYVGHSSGFDCKQELYQPLKESELSQNHEFVFPHEDSDELFDSKTYFREECDLFVAEVSRASTGLGIELGWADQFDVPILCVYRPGSNPSGSLKAVTDNIEVYESSEDLISIIRNQVD